MTNSEKKKIEKTLKFVERKKGITRKKLSLHKWGLMTTIISPDYYNKAAKRLDPSMVDPIVEFFNDAEEEDRETLIVLLRRLYIYKIDKIPLFFIDVIMDDSIAMAVRKLASIHLMQCCVKIPLDTIKKIYETKEFRCEILGSLSLCEDEARHEFAVDVLKGQPNPQITERVVHSLIAEKITADEAKLLQMSYSQSKDIYLRYYIMELLYKSKTEDSHDFFIAAYKKERLLPSRLQAIIGLYLKSDIETADKTMNEFVNKIMKRKNMDEHTLGDLRGMINLLSKLKDVYPEKGFHYAYETMSKIDTLKWDQN